MALQALFTNMFFLSNESYNIVIFGYTWYIKKNCSTFWSFHVRKLCMTSYFSC